jgi:hypothetical protein
VTNKLSLQEKKPMIASDTFPSLLDFSETKENIDPGPILAHVSAPSNAAAPVPPSSTFKLF